MNQLRVKSFKDVDLHKGVKKKEKGQCNAELLGCGGAVIRFFIDSEAHQK